MPSVITFDGRQYDGPSGCVARAATPLGRHGRAHQIGSVPVVFGSAIPILARVPRRSTDPAEIGIITQPGASCYIVYSLEGGP